ncbi:MAG: hypothetical protein H0U53_01860 [Actinobacteria bacterium]|nr:hypothetical protein [Actinomycetota bacterium]
MATATADQTEQTTNGEPAKEKKKIEPREYAITSEVVLNFSSEALADKSIAKLKEMAGEDGKLTVAARVGRAYGINQIVALKALAGAVDLDGDYDVTASSASKHFPKVKSVTKPSVSFG